MHLGSLQDKSAAIRIPQRREASGTVALEEQRCALATRKRVKITSPTPEIVIPPIRGGEISAVFGIVGPVSSRFDE